jgi:hypothetical protein
MESKTVEPDEFESADLVVSDELRDAVEEEMEYLAGRGLRLVRFRENDDGEVTQVTIQAGDEMYRLSEVSPGNVSRTVFRNPAPDEKDEREEKEEEEDAEEDGEEGDGDEEGSDEDSEDDADED